MGTGFCSLYHEIHYIEVRYIEIWVYYLLGLFKTAINWACTSEGKLSQSVNPWTSQTLGLISQNFVKVSLSVVVTLQVISSPSSSCLKEMSASKPAILLLKSYWKVVPIYRKKD